MAEAAEAWKSHGKVFAQIFKSSRPWRQLDFGHLSSRPAREQIPIVKSHRVLISSGSPGH